MLGFCCSILGKQCTGYNCKGYSKVAYTEEKMVGSCMRCWTHWLWVRGVEDLTEEGCRGADHTERLQGGAIWDRSESEACYSQSKCLPETPWGTCYSQDGCKAFGGSHGRKKQYLLGASGLSLLSQSWYNFLSIGLSSDLRK